MRSSHKLAAAAAIALVLAGCSRHAAPDAESGAVLTVTATPPVEAEVVQQVSASGSVVAWQEVSIGAEIGGYRLAEVSAEVGDRVRKGQVLASLDASVLEADLRQAEAGRAEAVAALAEADANAERARTLKASGALSGREADQLITGAATARARLQSADAQLAAARLRVSFAQLRAPDDGVISARSANPGQIVTAGTEMFRLIRRGRLEWRAEVQERDFMRVRAGLAAAIGDVKGRVRTVSPGIDARTRTGTAYVDLPADSSLRAGMFAEGSIEVGRAQGLAVPEKALVQLDGFDYLFVLKPGNTVEQRRVARGASFGGQVEITSGLAAGESVVIEGAGFLRDGDAVRVGKPAPAATVGASK